MRAFLTAGSGAGLEKVRLRALTPDHIEMTVQALLLGGRRPRTVRRIMAPVVGALNYRADCRRAQQIEVLQVVVVGV